MIFIAHQLGHKVSNSGGAAVTANLLTLLGVGTSIYLALGVFGVR